jgi:peptidoglycan/xylan/chitin deacetylase (PgdA/CDA1 family)
VERFWIRDPYVVSYKTNTTKDARLPSPTIADTLTSATGRGRHVQTGAQKFMLGWFWPLVFLGRAQRRLLRQGAPILTYHKIGPAPAGSRDPFLYATPQNMDAQLGLLAEAGLHRSNLSHFLSNPDNKQQFAVTFDDGFQNVLDKGLEVLARHKVCATQFIVSNFIGKRNEWDISKGDYSEPLMDASQIKEWLAAGHEIGSHSATHPNLKTVSLEQARAEIFGSKRQLEDQFGVAIKHFCYPFGGFTPAVRDLVQEAGYESASTVLFGVNDATTDRFALRRIIPLFGGEVARKARHRLSQRIRRR